MSRPQFAFLIEKLSTRAEGVHFIAKWRITVFSSNCFGLIYLANYLPSIITANVRPPSASMDFFNFSETRACSSSTNTSALYLGKDQVIGLVCVCPVWAPCVALPSGGGSSVGPSPLCGSPGWVPCVGPLCGSSLCGSPVWVPCVGPSTRRVASCGIYSRDVSRSSTRSRLPLANIVEY